MRQARSATCEENMLGAHLLKSQGPHVHAHILRGGVPRTLRGIREGAQERAFEKETP